MRISVNGNEATGPCAVDRQTDPRQWLRGDDVAAAEINELLQDIHLGRHFQGNLPMRGENIFKTDGAERFPELVSRRSFDEIKRPLFRISANLN